MPVTVDAREREQLLRYASFTLLDEDRADPVRAAAAAVPLLEYAEESGSLEELDLRMAALRQQHHNSVGSHPSPEEFVEAARVLRAFLGAATDAAVPWPVLSGGPGDEPA